MILNHHAWHHICILTMIHAFSMCDYYVEMMCAGRFGLGWAHDVFTVAYHMLRHTYLYFFIFLYWFVWCFSACPLLSLFLLLVALWHLNKNPLLLGTLFVPGQLLFLPPLILLHLTSSFVMIKPVKTFRRTSQTRHSFGMPSYSIRLFQYWSFHYHLQ